VEAGSSISGGGALYLAEWPPSRCSRRPPPRARRGETWEHAVWGAPAGRGLLSPRRTAGLCPPRRGWLDLIRGNQAYQPARCTIRDRQAQHGRASPELAGRRPTRLTPVYTDLFLCTRMRPVAPAGRGTGHVPPVPAGCAHLPGPPRRLLVVVLGASGGAGSVGCELARSTSYASFVRIFTPGRANSPRAVPWRGAVTSG